RLVLLAGGRLDGGDDLAGDAELGEGPEGGLPVGPEVTHGLEEADHPFLLDVVGVGPDEEVAAGLGPGEAPVPLEQDVEGVVVSALEPGDQLVVAQFSQGRTTQTHLHGATPTGM